ncbi:MAG TPA: matrixin family metalloprotease [Vicinamibacterales bacterium]|nr:matrixin family metalloprotease [Vicinamibacterales bacterium]
MAHTLAPRAVAAAAIAAFCQYTVAAGGPLTFDATGPITWAPGQTIDYRIDSGRLGAFQDPMPQTFAQAALDRWSQASTTLTFQQQKLQENVTSAVRYVELESEHTAGNVLVLDDDGDIVALLAGEGNRRRILGWAQPLIAGRRIGRFVGLMNGAVTSSKATLESTMTHEFGHALGLDHTQINSEFASNRNTNDDRFVPTMFPTPTNDGSSLVDLNPDDVAWIRQLYPSETTRRLYGTVIGRVVRDGRPVLGANVIASRTRALDGAIADPLMERFSCVSDYLAQADGTFRMQVLPGVYRLRIEPLRRGFSGGSSVGPYAETPSGRSFANPVTALNHAGTVEVRAGVTIDVGTLAVR